MEKIKVSELAKIIDAKIINIADDMTIENGYCGDFLSNVIGKAPSSAAWFTVMNNINVAGVAVLADISVIVICENVNPDDSLLTKAKIQGINILVSPYDVFKTVNKFYEKVR